jgi:hypothetical protein
MKAILLSLAIALLMVGCGSHGIKNSYYMGKEWSAPIGKSDGLQTLWYENGQKEAEGNFKDGKMDGLSITWYENGQKQWEENYKDGESDGLSTYWYSNGQKMAEVISADGKRLSAEVCKPNGEKCPASNLNDGNGVMVWYDEDDGTEISRETYQYGEVHHINFNFVSAERKKAEEIARKEAYHKQHIKPLDDALEAGEITEAQYALMHKQALTQQELEMRLDALDTKERAREEQRVYSAQALEKTREEWLIKQRQERLNRAAKRFGEQLGRSLVK